MHKPELPRDARPLLFFAAALAMLLAGAITLLLDFAQTNLLPAALIAMSAIFAVIGVAMHVHHEKKVRGFLAELQQTNMHRRISG